MTFNQQPLEPTSRIDFLCDSKIKVVYSPFDLPTKHHLQVPFCVHRHPVRPVHLSYESPMEYTSSLGPLITLVVEILVLRIRLSHSSPTHLKIPMTRTKTMRIKVFWIQSRTLIGLSDPLPPLSCWQGKAPSGQVVFLSLTTRLVHPDSPSYYSHTSFILLPLTCSGLSRPATNPAAFVSALERGDSSIGQRKRLPCSTVSPTAGSCAASRGVPQPQGEVAPTLFRVFGAPGQACQVSQAEGSLPCKLPVRHCSCTFRENLSYPGCVIVENLHLNECDAPKSRRSRFGLGITDGCGALAQLRKILFVSRWIIMGLRSRGLVRPFGSGRDSKSTVFVEPTAASIAPKFRRCRQTSPACLFLRSSRKVQAQAQASSPCRSTGPACIGQIYE